MSGLKRVIAAIYRPDDPAGTLWRMIVVRGAVEADDQALADTQCLPGEAAMLLAAPIETHKYRRLNGALQAIPGA